MRRNSHRSLASSSSSSLLARSLVGPRVGVTAEALALVLRLALDTRGGLPQDSRLDWGCDSEAAAEVVEGNRGVAGVEGARISVEVDAADVVLAVRARLPGGCPASAIGAESVPDGMVP